MKKGVHSAHLSFLLSKTKLFVKSAQKYKQNNDNSDKNGNNILQIQACYGILVSSSETFPKRRKKEQRILKERERISQ